MSGSSLLVFFAQYSRNSVLIVHAIVYFHPLLKEALPIFRVRSGYGKSGKVRNLPNLEKVWNFAKSFGNFEKGFGTFAIDPRKKKSKSRNICLTI